MYPALFSKNPPCPTLTRVLVLVLAHRLHTPAVHPVLTIGTPIPALALPVGDPLVAPQPHQISRTITEAVLRAEETLDRILRVEETDHHLHIEGNEHDHAHRLGGRREKPT